MNTTDEINDMPTVAPLLEKMRSARAELDRVRSDRRSSMRRIEAAEAAFAIAAEDYRVEPACMAGAGLACECERCSPPDAPECFGHEPGPLEPMGVIVYCDGSCVAGSPRRQNEGVLTEVLP